MADEGTCCEQVLTVGMLRKFIDGWDDGDRILVDYMGEFGRQTYLPVVGVGQVREADVFNPDRALMLYAMEGRDGDDE